MPRIVQSGRVHVRQYTTRHTADNGTGLNILFKLIGARWPALPPLIPVSAPIALRHVSNDGIPNAREKSRPVIPGLETVVD